MGCLTNNYVKVHYDQKRKGGLGRIRIVGGNLGKDFGVKLENVVF